MTNLLADYRSDLDSLLATAVDSATWTTAIKDQGLRMALDELNGHLVYETSFTVSVGGNEQDLSTLTAINNVMALAYPWSDGDSFGGRLAEWRITGVNKVYFTRVQPAVGEVMRVRYSKLHTIQNLDSAAATTVPDRDRYLVGLWAAAYCCDLRGRQISENPALPKEAGEMLRRAATELRRRAAEVISYVPVMGRICWGDVGL